MADGFNEKNTLQDNSYTHPESDTLGVLKQHSLGSTACQLCLDK